MEVLKLWDYQRQHLDVQKHVQAFRGLERNKMIRKLSDFDVTFRK